jgi:hypothetical protein
MKKGTEARKGMPRRRVRALARTVSRIAIGALGVACSNAAATNPDGGGGGGDGGGSGFSINDTILTIIQAPMELKKPPIAFYIGWMNCPVSDCDTSEVFVNGTRIGTVADLGTQGRPPATGALEAFAAAFRLDQNNTFKLAAGGQSSELTMRCPAMPDITAPTGSVSSGPVTVTWAPFSGVAADSGQPLAESSCAVDLLAFGARQPLASVAGKQVAATETSATLTLPAKFPDADSAVVSVLAAGAVVRTPQGGEANCAAIRYSAPLPWQ